MQPQGNRMDAINDIAKNIHFLLTKEHNEGLMRLITMQEVEIAFKSLHAGKSLGPDGFTMDFFHAHWDISK